LHDRYVLATHAQERAKNSSNGTRAAERGQTGDRAQHKDGRHLVNYLIEGFSQTKRLEAGESRAKPQVNFDPAAHTTRLSQSQYNDHSPSSVSRLLL
jgi:hypothetical protein